MPLRGRDNPIGLPEHRAEATRCVICLSECDFRHRPHSLATGAGLGPTARVRTFNWNRVSAKRGDGVRILGNVACGTPNEQVGSLKR